MGETVAVSIDGQPFIQEFAGKLAFQDRFHSWQSICADVRSPIFSGQVFPVRVMRSRFATGGVAAAGRIVARYFAQARTPDQCAALQVAVWKAIEDDGLRDFNMGHLRVAAPAPVMMLAATYFAAAQSDGGDAWDGAGANFLQGGGGGGGGGGGQGQLSP